MRRGLRAGLGLLILVCAIQNVSAQSFEETALLFSRTGPGGSARMQGIGGAQISLGGDYSTSLSNPAGVGMYNRSELALSLGFNSLHTSADYLNQTTNDSRGTLVVPGIGMAFHSDFNQTKGILTGTFVISYTRTNDFNKNVSYKGTNSDNSIIDYFIEQATGRTTDQFSEDGELYNTPTELAFNNYLIGDLTVLDPNADPTQYFTDVLGIPIQEESIQTRGNQSQWNFSYGANFNDRLFMGLGVGLTSLRFKSTKIYTEEFENEPLFDMRLQENLEIKGSGINATLGVIYRPINVFQIGFAAATPTYYELSDLYSASMSTNWDNFQYDPGTVLTHEEVSTGDLTSDYVLNTPWKLSMGATFFVGKNGFLSADVEKINYAKTKYKAGEQKLLNFDSENSNIRSLYQSVYNFRFGGEARVSSFRIRGGFSYMPDPYKSQQNNVANSVQTISGGVGYRNSKFYIDAAVNFSQSESSYRPYTVNSTTSPLVVNDQRASNVIVTVGFPFK